MERIQIPGFSSSYPTQYVLRTCFSCGDVSWLRAWMEQYTGFIKMDCSFFIPDSQPKNYFLPARLEQNLCFYLPLHTDQVHQVTRQGGSPFCTWEGLRDCGVQVVLELNFHSKQFVLRPYVYLGFSGDTEEIPESLVRPPQPTRSHHFRES